MSRGIDDLYEATECVLEAAVAALGAEGIVPPECLYTAACDPPTAAVDVMTAKALGLEDRSDDQKCASRFALIVELRITRCVTVLESDERFPAADVVAADARKVLADRWAIARHLDAFLKSNPDTDKTCAECHFRCTDVQIGPALPVCEANVAGSTFRVVLVLP